MRHACREGSAIFGNGVLDRGNREHVVEGFNRGVRKVPLMCRTVTFWATWRIWICDFGTRYDQTGRLYRRTGRVIAWNTVRQEWKSMPQTELPRRRPQKED